MGLVKYNLGELIEQRRERNKGYDAPIRGVTRDGFIPPKVERVDESTFVVFRLNDFVFNATRMELNSIVLNNVYEIGLCSPLYSVFYVSKPEILLPEYLNLYIKRSEFARRCGVLGFGSAHHKVTVDDIGELKIDLPPLPIQQKYVDVYNAMLANQRAYEQGLEDLKLTCDAYIERLRHELAPVAIGEYLTQSDERNTLGLDSDSVRGLSTSKEAIATKAKMDGVSVSNYKMFRSGQIAYVPDTSRRGEKISLAFNSDDEPYLVSSISTVFGTKANKLLPAYLMMFFSRAEFDRYTRFHSWGSARETFNWEDMQEVKIPLPALEVQQAIVGIYDVYLARREINERLKTQIKDICPILIKGSLEEAANV
jgi:type I restriction enzyme S subunit